MKRFFVALLALVSAVFFVAPAPATADASAPVVGKYGGTFTPDANVTARVGIDVIVGSIDAEGNVKGTVVFYGKFCNGSFKMEGTIAGQDVSIKVAPEGRCEERTLLLKVEGKRLVGRLFTKGGDSNVDVGR